jgi:hypothetical protein
VTENLLRQWSGAFLRTKIRLLVTKMFKRCMTAHNDPDFYRQLGQEAAQLVEEALDVLAQRFGLPGRCGGTAVLAKAGGRRL